MARHYGKLRRAFGIVFVAVGVLYLAFFSLATVGLGGIYQQRSEELTDHLSRIGIAGPFVTGTVLLLIGLLLLEGQKRTLMFLRPFHSVANELGVKSFARRLGNTFTVVALDDGQIDAPRFSNRDKIIAVLVIGPTVVILLFITAVLLPMDNSGMTAQIPAALTGSIAVGLLMRGCVQWTRPRSSPNRVQINREEGLSSTVRRVRRLAVWGLRFFMPRTLIVQTTDAFWKETVGRIGLVSDVVIIDISRTSTSIDWELKYLNQNKSGKFVIIANKDLYLPSPEVERPAEVVLYSHDPAGIRDLERHIRLRLQALVHGGLKG